VDTQPGVHATVFGPRLTASIGGLLVGVGMVLISTTNSYGVWLLGFGVLVGIGIGFGIRPPHRPR